MSFNRRLATLVLLTACGGSTTQETTLPQNAQAPRLDRLRFNQLALRLDLPLYWVDDTDDDGEPDPGEITALSFYSESAPRWVERGAFTSAYRRALARIQAEASAPPPTDPRLRLVVEELDAAAPTLLASDLRSLPMPHKRFAKHMLRVGELIDTLYARQVGMAALAPRLPDDPASRSLFRRNWGPRCQAPSTENEAACSAIPDAPDQPVDVYPVDLQAQEHFCVALEERPNADTLLGPFTAVRRRDDELVAVPYTEAYAEQMEPIAQSLEAAASAISEDANEAALVTYLRAAAQAFRDNDWEPADEAWSRMNARNSKWYVRVGPDEVYWDPCSHKAGFHLTLARIDESSLAWQDRLNPLQRDMENALATLVTPDVYTARDVSFHMPDFIAIVGNFGDDRDAFGATIGQSLPNWGPVAEEGRGRTVAMTNLYTDADSLARRRATAASLLQAETMALYSDDPEPGLVATILHEATHNLGPASEYRVGGKTDEEIFGGGMASMLEELKAQSGALYFLRLLRERGILDERQVQQTYVDSLVWALGHISRGMYTSSGWRKPYSQLAAIQVGYLMNEGALRFEPDADAANGEDRGAFAIDFERLPDAIDAMMRDVMQIKGAGNPEAANILAQRYVDGDVVPMALIRERFQRQPRASFVFAVRID